MFLRESNRSTALKTLSLRLRGAKVELEEAGLETDNMAESTATLQKKLLALTGGKVDIMLDENTFKSTTQILREMSEVWDDMTDIQQASALELMGGKRQANILASIISNFDTVEDVIETSMNSQGSAIEENTKWLDSIEGKTYQFTNALESMWNSMLNSDIIKFFLDLGTSVIKFAESIGPLPTILSTVAVYFTAIKKINPFTAFQDLGNQVYNYGKALSQIQAIQSLNTGKISTEEFNTQSIDAYAAAVSDLTAKKQAEALASSGLTKAQIEEAMAKNGVTDENIEQAISEAQIVTAKKQTINASGKKLAAMAEEGTISVSLGAKNWLLAQGEEQVTLAKIQNAVASGELSAAQAKEIISATGLTVANSSLSLSFKGLAASIKSIIASNPIGFAIMLGMAISSLVDKIETATDRTEKLKEEYNDLQSNISTLESNISSLESELDNIQDQIDEIQNKDSLSLADAEQLQLLKDEAEELERQKELQESLLEARESQNQTKTLSMINNLIENTAAGQEDAAESASNWGKAIGAVAGAAIAVGGIMLAPFSLGSSAAIGITAGAAIAGSSIGSKAGESIGRESKQVDDLIGWYESYENAISDAEKKASEAEREYFSNMTDDNYDAWQKKVEAVNTLQTEMYDGLEELNNYVSDLEYNDQTAEIIDSYNDLMVHLDMKGNEGDIDGQIDSIKGLREEYNKLSKGVDENGNNIALSAQEYSRYCSIVKQILGYTPELIQGYDSEGNAIFNNNTLLRDSIELLKEKQRIEAQELTSDDSILSTYNDAKDNYKDQTTDIKLDQNLSGKFMSALEDLVGEEQKLFQSDEDYILEHIDVISSKWGEVFSLAQQYEGEDFAQVFRKNFEGILAQIQYADGAFSEFKERLFTVPEASNYYDDLSGEHLEFINAYINTFEDVSDLTDKEVIQIRNSILNLTNSIGTNKNAQNLINKLFEVDESLPVSQYRKAISSILEELVSEDIIDDDIKSKLYDQLIPDDENIDIMLKAVKDKISNADKDFVNSLNYSELKIAYRVVADVQEISFDELKEQIASQTEDLSHVVQTYSTITDKISNFNEIAQQTSEIVLDNTKVTQGYKDALIELVGNEEEVNECFSDGDPLVVKNTDSLKKLLKQTKGNISNNIDLARSQSRLEYYELYKQIRDLTNGRQVENQATLDQIYALYDQMGAIERSIAKYSLLEQKLLGAADAYDTLSEAQTVDEETDYRSKAEEMMSVAMNAFNTAELGTEAAQAAIKGLVPESVYSDLDTLDEKMHAIFDYLTKGNITKYFEIEFDDEGAISSVETTIDGVKAFLNDGIEKGVFTGTWEHFDLSEDITTLDQLADKMNVTKEVAFAFLNTLEDYDISWVGGDYSTLLDQLLGDDIETRIYSATQALTELELKIAEGTATDEDIKKYGQLNTELGNLADKARENNIAWSETSAKLEKAKEDVSTYTKELEDAQAAGSNWDGRSIEEIKEDLNNAANEAKKCGEELGKLDEPTELTLQVALDDVQAEIDAFKEKNSTLLTKVEIMQDEDGEFEYEVKAGVTLSEDEKKKLEEYLEDLDAQYSLEGLVGEEPKTAEEHLSSIEEILQKIQDIMTGDYKEEPAANSESGSSSEKDNSSNEVPFDAEIEKFFTETIPGVASEIGESLDGFFTETIPETISEIKDGLGEFFTETLPEKWDEFWDEVGSVIGEVGSYVQELYDKVNEFFTESIPEAWGDFWDGVYEFVTEDVAFAIGYAAHAVYNFFTVTLPDAWDSFWEDVGSFFDTIGSYVGNTIEVISKFFNETLPNAWNNFWDAISNFFTVTIPYALSLVGEKISEFFTVTIPEHWNSFWTSVSTFFTQTIPNALNKVGEKLTTFFTVTIPEYWDSFWTSVSSFVTTTIPKSLQKIGEGVTTFFTETLPGKINGLWDDITSWVSNGLSNFWSNVKEGWNSFTGGSNSNSGGKTKGTRPTRVDGTAHAKGSWGAPKTETALVGELGPEMLVRDGRWTTVGENGAEFTEVKRGDIIFNHKQTEDLLSKGYVTSRGKAYASGTAYPGGVYTWDYGYNKVKKYYKNTKSSSKSSSSNSAKNAKDAADEFKEVFDWFEVKLEEINEQLDLMSAKLENAALATSKNKILDSMIKTNKSELSTLEKGLKLYNSYANSLLNKIPKKYRTAAKNGKISIETFEGETDEKTLEAIKDYREWAQKAADLKVKIEEVRTEIAELAKQKFDNLVDRMDKLTGIRDHKIQQFEDMVDLREEEGNPVSERYYNSMRIQTEYKLKTLQDYQKQLQDSLNKSVQNGDIKKYSDEWYEMVDQIYEVDHAIDECTMNFEEFQNAINEIHWDNFDELINRLGYLSDETQNLIDLMGEIEDPVITPEGKTYKNGTVKFWSEEDVKWSDEGITQLGLYAQQMEIAEYQSKQYKEQIEYLDKEYKAGKYSQTEYYEKLNELKDAQYDAIDAYYDARDAIVDLQDARVEMIKEGIEKEIDAYEELIEKKKEELDAEKDLYDFQKSTREQQKDIATLQRKLAALSTDNSASAIAERKRLEAELAEAKAELEDTYYDRSIDQRQEALDKELESFQDEKEREIEKWEEYLDNVEQIVADSLLTVQTNASTVYDTLNAKADEYGLNLSDAITEPWKKGEDAVASFDEVFGNSMSATMEQLKAVKAEWEALIAKMDSQAKTEISQQTKENNQITAAVKESTSTTTSSKKTTTSSTSTNTPKTTTTKTIKTGGKINAKGAKIYSYKGAKTGYKQYYSSNPIYTVLAIDGSWLKVRHKSLSSGVTGWFKKSDVSAYAKGSKNIKKDQLALIDELGEELILRPDGNGRLSYLEKGTGVVPADLTSNLMAWGELDPTDMLERNKPSVGLSPEVHNTEINLDCSVGELVHIEHCDQNTLPDVEKIVNEALEKHTQRMNQSLRKYVR